MPTRDKRPVDQPTTRAESKRQRRAANPERERAIDDALYARRKREAKDIETIIKTMSGDECKRILLAEAQRDAKFAHCVLTYFDKSRGHHELAFPSVADFLEQADIPVAPPISRTEFANELVDFYHHFHHGHPNRSYLEHPMNWLPMENCYCCRAPTWYFPAIINSRSPTRTKVNALIALRIVGKVVWNFYPELHKPLSEGYKLLSDVKEGFTMVTNLLSMPEKKEFIRQYGPISEFTDCSKHKPGEFRTLGVPEWEEFRTSKAAKSIKRRPTTEAVVVRDLPLKDDVFIIEDDEHQAEEEDLVVIKQEYTPENTSVFPREQDEDYSNMEQREDPQEVKKRRKQREYYWHLIQERCCVKYWPALKISQHRWCLKGEREMGLRGVSQAMKDACKEVFGSKPA